MPSSEDGQLWRWDIFPRVPSVKADGSFALPPHPVSGSCESQVIHRDPDLLPIHRISALALCICTPAVTISQETGLGKARKQWVENDCTFWVPTVPAHEAEQETPLFPGLALCAHTEMGLQKFFRKKPSHLWDEDHGDFPHLWPLPHSAAFPQPERMPGESRDLSFDVFRSLWP